MNKQDWIIVILVITIASMGLVIRDMSVVEHKSDYVRINNAHEVYIVSTDSTYHSVYVSDEFGECYYIYIENGYGRTVIECVDTMIEGNVTTAKEWRDAILMTLDEAIL